MSGGSCPLRTNLYPLLIGSPVCQWQTSRMAETGKRVRYVCGKCGSTNVISDTRAEWDARQQEWIVVGHYDSSECLNCEAEDAVIEVVVR